MKTLFVGDICPTDITREGYATGNTAALFSDTVTLFNESEFTFANLECAITDSDGAIKKYGPNLKAPVKTAKVLADLKITVAGLSNNHVFDFGRKGALDTIDALTKAGVDYTGFGNDYEDSRRNYVFEKDGEKICVIAVCEHEYSYALDDRMGSRPFDEFETLEDIREAKKTADRVIVAYHGGKELCEYPSPRLMRACRAMARAGADLILTQHSHCIGTYENYNGSHILYGQGNFNFVGLYKEEMWKTGLAVKYDTKANAVEFVPICVTDDGIRLANDDEKADIMAKFADRSATIENGKWRDGWHKFCVDNIVNYTDRVKYAHRDEATERDNGMFAHYLDCEAHTDVWRELFPTYNQTNEKD
ncbi:MAG: CapA family protein [Clostridia bacterium]|nr:CapA family protein [Clostridia bacterium]